MDIESQLVFSGYTVDEIKFIRNENCTIDAENITLKFGKEIKVDDTSIALVSLSALIFENAIQENYPFELTVKLTGEFNISNLDKNLSEIMLNQNCIAILFPYLRAIISTYTALANVPPILLPAVNITNMFENTENK